MKKYSIKDTVSIKISFMNYMKWTRVMLPVVFEELELVCGGFFCFIFLFTVIVKLIKEQISRGIQSPFPTPLDFCNSEP